MESSVKRVYMISADLGGTNSRFHFLKLCHRNDQDSKVEFLPYETLNFKHIPTERTLQPYEEIVTFIQETLAKPENSDIQRSMIKLCVLSIAGPVNSQGECMITCDIPHWSTVSEAQLQDKLGIPICRLLNDYTANGYGIVEISQEHLLSIYSSNSSLQSLKEGDQEEENKEAETKLPQIKEDRCRVIIGVGTGLGQCMMARPSEDLPFHHYPSEAGIAYMQLYNINDRKFYEFLTQKKKISFAHISIPMAGLGLPLLLKFIATQSEESRSKYNKETCPILRDKNLEFPEDDGQSSRDVLPTAQEITTYAREHKDPLCLEVCYYFLDYLAKFVADQAVLYLCTGGIFLNATVIQAMQFIFEGEEYAHVKKKFIDVAQNKGPVKAILEKIDINLVTCKDLAIRGCVNYVKQNKLYL